MMQLQAEKSKKKQLAAGDLAAQPVQGKTAFQLQDNRPQAIVQKKQVQALENKQAPAPLNTPVIQCWLDTSLLKGKTKVGQIHDLAAQANAYNANRKGKTRTMRIDELQALHVSAMLWLDHFAVPDQNVSGNALWVKELMNAVQVEHQQLVQQSVEKQDADPPVANFAALPDAEQKRVRRIWSQLVNGTGNVQITETEDYTNTDTGMADAREHEGFRYEVLAQFARLLETGTGRALVAEVNKSTEGKKPVTIKPAFAIPSQGAPGGEFAAGPAVSNNSDKMVEVNPSTMFSGEENAKKKRAAYRQRFVQLNLAAIVDPKQKSAAIYEARRANPAAAGLLIAGKYYKFGKGSAVNVTVTRDIRDAEDHHTSRFVDADRNEIPAPNFITLGHELGHASHMLTGSSLGDNSVSDQLLPVVGVNGNEAENWSNMEEFANINTVENALRGEYGMKARFGHINQSSVQRARLNPIIDSFYGLCDEQPVPQRAAVDAYLGQAGAHTGSMEIPEARISIRNAAITFSAQLNTSFPAFTGGEIAAIRHQVQLLQTNVASAHEDVLIAAGGNITQARALITAAKTRVQHAVPVPAPVPARGFFRSLLPF